MQAATLVFQIVAATAAVVILITIIYSRKQLAEAISSREAGYLSERIEQWHSLEMLDDVRYAEAVKESGHLDAAYLRERRHYRVMRAPDFFNSLAALLTSA